MPIRRRPPNRSMLHLVSAQTRATIAPTVRQATRINSHTAVFEHATASQATVSSKAKVVPGVIGAPTAPPPPWAHGWDFTRGASASSTTCTVPQSRPRHRRRPSPRSYQGALQPQRPQRRQILTSRPYPRAPPACRRRRLLSRTPRPRCPRSPCAGRHPAARAITSHCARVPRLQFSDLAQARNLKRQRRAPSHINNAPTEVSEEPKMVGNRQATTGLNEHD